MTEHDLLVTAEVPYSVAEACVKAPNHWDLHLHDVRALAEAAAKAWWAVQPKPRYAVEARPTHAAVRDTQTEFMVAFFDGVHHPDAKAAASEHCAALNQRHEVLEAGE